MFPRSETTAYLQSATVDYPSLAKVTAYSTCPKSANRDISRRSKSDRYLINSCVLPDPLATANTLPN